MKDQSSASTECTVDHFLTIILLSDAQRLKFIPAFIFRYFLSLEKTESTVHPQGALKVSYHASFPDCGYFKQFPQLAVEIYQKSLSYKALSPVNNLWIHFHITAVRA